MVTGPELPHTIRARLDVNEVPPLARRAASVPFGARPGVNGPHAHCVWREKGERRREKTQGRRTGRRGWCYADPPMHTPRKRARTPQEPRAPAGASGAPIYFGRSTTMRLAGWWAARCACDTACFPLGGRVGHRRAGTAIAREEDGGDDGVGSRSGGGDGRADGAPLAARGVAVWGKGAADVADAGGSVCGRVAVGGGASVGGRHGGAAAGANAVRVAL